MVSETACRHLRTVAFGISQGEEGICSDGFTGVDDDCTSVLPSPFSVSMPLERMSFAVSKRSSGSKWSVKLLKMPVKLNFPPFPFDEVPSLGFEAFDSNERALAWDGSSLALSGFVTVSDNCRM